MFPTLVSLFDPIVDAIEKTLDEQFVENQVKFNRELIRGLYLFGSQVYFCKKHKNICTISSSLKFRSMINEDVLEYLDDSDFDIILVCDEMISRDFSEGGLASDLQFKVYFDLPIKTFDGIELDVEFEVSLLNTKYFISFVNYHQPVLLQLISTEELDERFVIFEDKTMERWRRDFSKWFLRIPRLKYSFIHELNYSMNKSFRFWNSYIESSQTDESSLKKVKKNICHGFRLLRFAHQILVHGSVTDFSETNDFYNQVFIKTQNYTSWKEYEQEYQFFYDKLEEKFESLCNAILDKAESLLCKSSSELAILSFLKKSKGIIEDFPTIDDFENREIAANSLNFLFDGSVNSISKIFSVRVHPFRLLTDITTFEFSLDPLIHRSENPLVFFKRNDILQCNGIVVKQMEGMNFRVLCLPRPHLLDFREMEKRVGSVEQEKINSFLLTREGSYRCFKKPFGKSVNMFFECESHCWVVASPDLDYNEWKETIYLRGKEKYWKDEFWNCFKELGMKIPSDTNKTFMFCWNVMNHTITFTGRIENESYSEKDLLDYGNIGNQFHWNVMERLSSLDLYNCSSLTVKDQNDWLSSLSSTVLELDPNIYEGFLLILENRETVNYYEFSAFELRCPIHHHIKILNLTNKNYPNYEILDSHIIENPPRSLINSEKIDQHLLECAVLSNFDISEVIQLVNPIFHLPYQTMREKYQNLCTILDAFYHEHVQKYTLSKIGSLSLQLSLNQHTIHQKQLKDLMFRLKNFENSHTDHHQLQSHTFFQHYFSILQTQSNQKKARVELQSLFKFIKLYYPTQ